MCTCVKMFFTDFCHESVDLMYLFVINNTCYLYITILLFRSLKINDD